MAGGGGADGRSRRRRKGREVSAAIPARESAQGRTEQEKRREPPKPGAVPPEGAEARRPGGMAEVGGEGSPAATLCLRLPVDLSPEGRQLSEQERSNLPPRLRPLRPLGEEKLGRTFSGRESRSGRKREQQGKEGGRGRASGRGRSRRRQPRLPHPRARLAGAGGREAEGARGARPGAGGMRPRGRARRGPGARLRAERGNVEPELPSWRLEVLGDVTALESEECRAAGAPSAGPGEVAHF